MTFARLGTMIDELLQYVRSRNVELRKEWVDLNQLVKSNQELFAKDTIDRHIRWEISGLLKVRKQILSSKLRLRAMVQALT